MERAGFAQDAGANSPSLGQQTPAAVAPAKATPTSRPSVGAIYFSVEALGGYSGDAGIHGFSGSFSSSRVGGRIEMFTPLSKQLIVGVNAGVGETFYYFSGPTGLIPGNAAPWQDIREYSIGGFAKYQIDNHWDVFANLDVSSAGETDSNFDESLSVGGGVGFTYTFSKELKLGLGLQAASRQESSAFVLPVPIVDYILPWDPQERWRFEIGAGDVANVRAGIIFSPTKKLSFSLGLAAVGLGNQFRLDRNGPVPDGLGRATSFPVVIGVDWHPRPYFRIGAFAGVIAAGTLEVLDKNGNQIGKRNFDPAPTIGINARFTF